VPSSKRLWKEGIGQYLDWCRDRGLQEITLKDYRYSLWRTFRLLTENGLPTGIQSIGEHEIRALRDKLILGGTDYKKQELNILGAFLEHHGNSVYKRMALKWPPPTRPTVKWHSVQEQERLWMEAQGRELGVLHFGLELCMRRIELIRLRWEDISNGQIRILGKGRKERVIPQHPGTPAILMEMEAVNGNRMGYVFQDTNPFHSYQDKPLHKNTMDLILKGLEERTGVRTSFHTLRRTGARNLWECGVRIETIAEILGHAETRTTMRYIGVQITDMAEAYQLALNRGRPVARLPSIK
jgi:integrase